MLIAEAGWWEMLTEKNIRHILDGAFAGSDMAPPREAERQALSVYMREVGLWSERIHLVGRGGLEKNLTTQLLDSLLMLTAAEKSRPALFERPAPRLADIGSGAGFPGIAWKILRPKMNAVLFERRLKPYSFLARMIALLDLEGAMASNEDAAGAQSGAFDIATAKAAGRLATMLPIAERLTAAGGLFVTIKGSAWEAELRGAIAPALRLADASELPGGRGFTLIFSKRA